MVVKLGPAGRVLRHRGHELASPRRSWPARTGHRTVNGRTYSLYFDGSNLRVVAFRQGNAVYWVTNTLLRTLTNKQMMGIATSMTRSGGH